MSVGAVAAVGTQPSAFIYANNVPTLRQPQASPLAALTSNVEAVQSSQKESPDSAYIYKGELTVSTASLQGGSGTVHGMDRRQLSQLADALSSLNADDRAKIPSGVKVDANNIGQVTQMVQDLPQAGAALPGADFQPQFITSGMMCDLYA
ncbi:MAG TPA: hypothetical protein PKM88_03615 [bacterium]|nr:hypothetical protein [bacterium]